MDDVVQEYASSAMLQSHFKKLTTNHLQALTSVPQRYLAGFRLPTGVRLIFYVGCETPTPSVSMGGPCTRCLLHVASKLA